MSLDINLFRNTWCILGLPFDAINLEQATRKILTDVEQHSRCFLSTPNLNWICASQSDHVFRESVINSDLSIADGLPIVLVAKLLGIPLSERVAGSDLMEKLYRRETDTSIKVFFFGGEPGVGEVASQKINQAQSGLVAVGSYSPGFGSVEEMSKSEIINIINQHEVDFLIVSLGAKKGQIWIENNRHQLNAPIISHLGAVINFFGGTVKRAPAWMQHYGFEWLWRIIQEPVIWKRYFFDGLQFAQLLVKNVLPYAIWLRLNKHLLNDNSPVIATIEEDEHAVSIKLTGSCTIKTIETIKTIFGDLVQKRKNIILDLFAVPVIDSAFLGLCILLLKDSNLLGYSVQLTNANNANQKIIQWCCANYLIKT